MFVFAGSAPLCGESVQYTFFEPRYLLLASEVTARQGYFLVRSSPHVSMLLRVVEHAQSPVSQQISVRCLAGPRVTLSNEMSVAVDDGGRGNSEPLLRAEFAWVQDVPAASVQPSTPKGESDPSGSHLSSLRDDCLSLLLSAMPRELVLSQPEGLPPLDPERFSFWALRFVLHPKDVDARRQMLLLRSTAARLLHVKEILVTVLARPLQPS